MRGRVLRGRRRAVVVAALSLGLAGCAANAGGPAAGGPPPIAATLASAASDVAVATRSRTGTSSGRPPARRTRGRSGYPAVIGGLPQLGTTAPAPARPRDASDPAALAPADAGRLAAPACATLRDAVGGRLPDVVARRGGQSRGPAVVTQAVAAALLGLPIDVPAAARAEHRRLVAAHGALTAALNAPGAAANAGASARTAVRAYAASLGIERCG
jgi:hypothetical protein